MEGDKALEDHWCEYLGRYGKRVGLFKYTDYDEEARGYQTYVSLPGRRLDFLLDTYIDRPILHALIV